VDFSFRTNGIFFVSLDVLFLLNLKIFCCWNSIFDFKKLFKLFE
jgi:hypothetical protein